MLHTKRIRMRICLILLLAAALNPAKAQRAADSAGAARTFIQLLSACRNIDYDDPATTNPGIFHKAAPYIIYHGGDKKRRWKSFADYRRAEDKKGVDEICTRINETLQQDSGFRIVKYMTEKEQEGTWHVLIVSCSKKGAAKQVAFAFLKLGSRFGLGDID